MPHPVKDPLTLADKQREAEGLEEGQCEAEPQGEGVGDCVALREGEGVAEVEREGEGLPLELPKEEAVGNWGVRLREKEFSMEGEGLAVKLLEAAGEREEAAEKDMRPR